MQGYFAIAAFLLLVGLVLCRVVMLKSRGMQAFVFGKTHRTDFILPPIVLFFVYHLFANAFGWPVLSGPLLFDCAWLRWLGVCLCLAGLLLFCWGLVSFGASFRVGIDQEKPNQLITRGAFAISRNPLYVAFALHLAGFFLVFPRPLFLIFLLAGLWLLHRQTRREEVFLKSCYGREYTAYCQKVRRYL